MNISFGKITSYDKYEYSKRTLGTLSGQGTTQTGDYSLTAYNNDSQSDRLTIACTRYEKSHVEPDVHAEFKCTIKDSRVDTIQMNKKPGDRYGGKPVPRGFDASELKELEQDALEAANMCIKAHELFTVESKT